MGVWRDSVRSQRSEKPDAIPIHRPHGKEATLFRPIHGDEKPSPWIGRREEMCALTPAG
jgi:hypothetical protein